MSDFVTFSETGINDDVERSPVSAGMQFLIKEVSFKNSPKFGAYATINALTPQEKPEERLELNLYTTSKVLTDQLKALARKYNIPDGGVFNPLIMVEASEVAGENNNYLSFV